MREIENEDGTKETVYTQAELDEMRAKDKEHVDSKLKEFETGKTAAELANIKRDEEVALAKKTAEEALAKVGQVENQRVSTVKNYIAEQYVGTDADLRKKLDEAFDLISAGRTAKGLDVSSEASIQEIFKQASNMAGISNVASPAFPTFGGLAPNFQRPTNDVSDSDHEAFKKATGYVDPKPNEAVK